MNFSTPRNPEFAARLMYTPTKAVAVRVPENRRDQNSADVLPPGCHIIVIVCIYIAPVSNDKTSNNCTKQMWEKDLLKVFKQLRD